MADPEAPMPIAYRLLGLVLPACGLAFVVYHQFPRARAFVEGVAASELARADLAQTPAAFIDEFGGEALDELRVQLWVSGSPFEIATVEWNREGTFITSVSLVTMDEKPDKGPLIERIQPYLGNRFTRREGSFGARYDADAGLMLTGEVFHFWSQPNEDQDDAWQARGRALWTVLGNVALGGKRKFAPGERELLVGHPLRAFAEIDPGVVVDRAEAHVRTLFPRVHVEQSTELELEVECDHPWFGSVTLSWRNEPGARLSLLQLSHPASHRDLPDREGIVRCLEPILGAPQVYIDDLTRVRSYSWQGADMINKYIWFHLPNSEAAKSRLRAILSALDRCGR